MTSSVGGRSRVCQPPRPNGPCARAVPSGRRAGHRGRVRRAWVGWGASCVPPCIDDYIITKQRLSTSIPTVAEDPHGRPRQTLKVPHGVPPSCRHRPGPAGWSGPVVGGPRSRRGGGRPVAAALPLALGSGCSAAYLLLLPTPRRAPPPAPPRRPHPTAPGYTRPVTVTPNRTARGSGWTRRPSTRPARNGPRPSSSPMASAARSVTWSPRRATSLPPDMSSSPTPPGAFGQSGGRVHLNDPAFEIADAVDLVDRLAADPRVELDAPGDPRVGVASASYGGRSR